MATMTDPAAWGHAGRRTAGPAVAGLVYVAAWVTGLVIGPASLDVTAPGTAVVTAYAESQGAAIAQALLTQGVAAVALAVVVLALGQRDTARRLGRSGRRQRPGRPSLRVHQPHRRREDAPARDRDSVRNGTDRRRGWLPAAEPGAGTRPVVSAMACAGEPGGWKGAR